MLARIGQLKVVQVAQANRQCRQVGFHLQLRQHVETAEQNDALKMGCQCRVQQDRVPHLDGVVAGGILAEGWVMGNDDQARGVISMYGNPPYTHFTQGGGVFQQPG